MWFINVFIINKKRISIKNDRNIKFVSQDFINITIEASPSAKKE